MSLRHLLHWPIMSSQIKHITFERSLHKFVYKRNLKQVISEKIDASQSISTDFRKNYRSSKVCDITVDKIYEGMHDIPCFVCEMSSVDESKGISLQGYSIPDCYRCLTKAKIGQQPMPEGLFWLLMTGDMPIRSQTETLSKEWLNMPYIEPHVITMINNFPVILHPMTQLSAAITLLSNKSKLRQAYSDGVHKINYWKYVYEDSIDLIASLPALVALVYKKYAPEMESASFFDGDEDWCAMFAKLLGYSSSDFISFLRLYICFGHDNDHGNTSMHAAHIVGSALSDPYLAFASSLNLLAGPLLSNEKAQLFLKIMQSYVGSDPSDKMTNDVMHLMLNSSPTIPGVYNKSTKTYRPTDVRLNYFKQFGNKYLPEDPLFKLATQVARLGHSHLITVDVLAGIFFEFYKVQTNFQPVMMSLSHLIRIVPSLVWDRALGYPIEHPISMSTNCLMKACNQHHMTAQAVPFV